ncbi:MAG: ATP-binding protein [Rhodothermales bacterium]
MVATTVPLRRALAVAGLLIAGLAGTWVLGWWHQTQYATTTTAEQQVVLDEALSRIESDFLERQRALLNQAEALAQDDALIRSLRTLTNAAPTTAAFDLAREALFRQFAALDLPNRTAAELYNLTPQVVVWSGFSMPLDAAPASTQFMSRMQTAMAEDEGHRQALVVWIPVRDGTEVLGAVRLMESIAFSAPVQNQYLRDYSLQDEWRRMTQRPVRVVYGDAPTGSQALDDHAARVLQGLDGTPLARVFVEPPTETALVAAIQAQYGHVLAFWTTLLLGWSIAVLWMLYRTTRGQTRALLWLAFLSMAWWGVRYALLALDVPGRWQPGRAPLAPLFDPTHLASDIGGGLARSTGDILLTGLFALAHMVVLFDFIRYLQAQPPPRSSATQRPRWQAALTGLGLTLIVGMLTMGLAILTERIVLDSTLDYLDRTSLSPEPLVLLIFVALLLCAAAVALAVLLVGRLVGLRWLDRTGTRLQFNRQRVGFGLAGLLFGAGLMAFVLPTVLVGSSFALFLGISGIGTVTAQRPPAPITTLFQLRTVLLTIFVVTLAAYPLFYQGVDQQRRLQMQDAADAFGEGRDAPVAFAIEQLIYDFSGATGLDVHLADAGMTRRAALDSLTQATLRQSMATSLRAYDVSLVVFDTGGRVIGSHYEAELRFNRTSLDEGDELAFEVLEVMYDASGFAQQPIVEQVTGRREPTQFDYAAFMPLYNDRAQRVGWVLARAEPHTLRSDTTTPFPRILTPAGYYDALYADLSMAEFRQGVLVRSFRRDFGRYRLDAEVQNLLLSTPEVWRKEEVKEKTYLTYYRRQQATRPGLIPALRQASTNTAVVAVRVRSVGTFDHLYYLLRLTLGGLALGLLVYLLGLYLRRQAGLLPAPKVQFRDRVLNAFLFVGIVTVTLVGYVGREGIVEETDGAIRHNLEQHLDRVEETLAFEARGGELPYRVLGRTQIDSLAAQVGLDLNLYQDERLVGSSRPQLIEDRLIDRRLPASVFKDLYYDGFRFTYATQQIGSVGYVIGYHAIPDEQGRPQYVLSLPILPGQERIEEERARNVAYLFGALLLLVVVVLLTASLIANALTRPIAYLREGLRQTGKGEYTRVKPIKSRDEIGELMETFNAMQEQLAESRRQLTQQERQLAWREMARQVAHEIKNPLTPMKLSVQHLRRAYSDIEPDTAPDEPPSKFHKMFGRVTNTLIEQIDTLARIANDFSTFARLPKQILERLDLNAIIQEAIDLMQAEASAEIVFDQHPTSLMVQADHEELRRIYINLIKNAMQAIPEERTGRIVVTTTLRTSDNGQAMAHSAVRDNGEGVPAEIQPRIFEPNFSTKTSGTGLGLAITRKAIEEMKGDIGFETEEGVGATFWILLPLAE